MIEDALKVTRNLQRLLLVACVVAIVFLASLRDVSREQALLEDLAQLPTIFDDAEYARWLEARSDVVFGVRQDDLQELMENLVLRLPPGFDVTDLRRVLAAPAHISRGSVPQLDIQAHSLRDLGRMAWEIGGRDARMVFAATDGDLLDRLAGAITEVRPGARASIRNTRLNLRDPHADDQPHVYLDKAAESMPLELYFEIYTPGRSAPTRAIPVEAMWYRIPRTSIVDWWRSQSSLPTGFFMAVTARTVVPPLDLSDSLVELRGELERRVATAQAANRTIDLAGVSIPGSLALFGIPAILLGFAGSLLIHLRHLHRLAAEHRQTFRQFSWTPVSPGDLWLWETTGLLLVLPVAVHLLLIYRAPAFGGAPVLPVFAGFGGAVGTALAGVALLRSIGRLRRRLYLR